MEVFKIGDRVERINKRWKTPNGAVEIGMKGTVIKLQDGGVEVEFDEYIGTTDIYKGKVGHYCGMLCKNLRLVAETPRQEFKQRIRGLV